MNVMNFYKRNIRNHVKIEIIITSYFCVHYFYQVFLLLKHDLKLWYFLFASIQLFQKDDENVMGSMDSPGLGSPFFDDLRADKELRKKKWTVRVMSAP